MQDVNTMASLTDTEVDTLLQSFDEPHPRYDIQADAWAAGPFVVQTVAADGTRHFYSYTDQTSRASHAGALAATGLEVIERIDGSRPAFPCLDIDAGPDLSDADLCTIADTFRETLSAFGAEDTSIAAYGYDSTTRRSRHLIAQDVLAPNGGIIRDISRAVRDAVPARLRDAVDSTGGIKSFGLRLPHCGKKGDMSKTLRLLWSDCDDPCPWVQDGSVCQILAGADKEQPAAAETEAAVPDIIEAFVARIEKAFPHFSRGADTGDLPTWNRVTPAECSSCARVHERAGAYISRSSTTGALFLNCRRASPGTAALMVHGAGAQKEPAADSFDTAPAPDTLADERYNSDAFAVEIASNADLYVRAPWKTGKTVFAGKIIGELLERDPNARVLVITCRKTLSTALAADFAATDYRRIKGDFTEELAKRHPVTVWQIESLRRIPSELRAFDLVVVDEPGAAFAHVYQPNANSKARGGLSKARGLIRAAKRLYVSDNDLTEAHIDAFKAIRTDKTARVLVNEFKSWKDVPTRVTTGKAAPTVVRQRLFDFLDAQAEARKAGRHWTGCVVPCHSRKVANGIAEEVRQRYGSDGVKLYTSESDQHEKDVDFARATAAWSDSLAVVYTGSLSVGVSATTEHITHCFAFFTSGNAGVAQCCQMLFRARELREIEIAYDGVVIHGLPQTELQLFDWATKAGQRGAIPDQFRADLMPDGVFGGLQTQEDPSALSTVVNGSFEGRAWVCDQLERHRSARWFIPRMIRTLEAAGCTVTVSSVGRSLDKAATVVGIPARVLKNTDEAASSATTAAENTRNELAAAQYPTAIAEFEDQIIAGETDDSRVLTAPEIQGRRALHAARTYVDGGGLTFAEISALNNEERAAWLSYYATPQVTAAYRALTSIVKQTDQRYSPNATGGVQTATSSAAEACGIVRRAFDAVGCKQALMTGEEGNITIVDLSIPSHDIIKVVDEINAHSLRVFGDNKASRRQKALAKEYTVRKVVGTLNIALKHVGAEIIATYRTEWEQKQRKNAQCYTVIWHHTGAPAAGAPPLPTVRHPTG